MAAYLIIHFGADRAKAEKSESQEKSDKAAETGKNDRTPVSTPRA
jgi:hypothetical protein